MRMLISGFSPPRELGTKAIGYVWTAENDSNMLSVDAEVFCIRKKMFAEKKIPDTSGHDGFACLS